jgi:hypothetical protein
MTGVLVDFLGVWGSGATDVWVVGTFGAVEHWDGTAWSPVTSGVSGRINAVAGSGPNDVWAVGVGGLILHHP